MESFVLNLFSDQLSKIILDFHKSTINASFLSGRGSITNVRLNVDAINAALNDGGTLLPFLEFTEITLTELRVEVTSYTNLKRAPIVLVIEEVHAHARETLDYRVGGDARRRSNKHDAKGEADVAKGGDGGGRGKDDKQGPAPAAAKQQQNQQYGLLHRILDNLSIKVKRINLSFSSLGKFKTRHRGPWTPPALRVRLDDVEWICVTEGGNPGTPDMVWAHNDLGAQQGRFRRDAANTNVDGGGGGLGRGRGQTQGGRHRTYVIYKRLSMNCSVELLSGLPGGGGGGLNAKQGAAACVTTSSSSSSSLLSDAKVEVYLAYVRRLRDASVTGADVDVLVRDVDINLDVASSCDATAKLSSSSTTSECCDMGAFVHMLVGLLHCYYKDRSFVDPFVRDDGTAVASSEGGGDGDVGNDNNQEGLLRGFGEESSNKDKDGAGGGDEEIGPDEFLPEVAMMDDDLDSSDESDYDEEPDEEHDEAYLEWKRKQDGNDGHEDSGGDGGADGDRVGEEPTPVDKEVTDLKASDKEAKGDDDPDAHADDSEGKAKSYKRKRKAVVVVASGAQKFEKLSFSLSVGRVNMKLNLPANGEAESRANSLDASDTIGMKRRTPSIQTHHHCLELLLEGVVAECIWPKDNSGEMGGHVQGSMKYLHIIDSIYEKEWGAKDGEAGPKPWNVVKILPLLRMGSRLFEGHDSFALASKLNSRDSVSFTKCDEFPLMEPRNVTWTWDKHIKGPRAFAFKSTVSFVDETLTRWSKTKVEHEVSLGEIELVLDTAPLGRLHDLFSDPRNQSALWFDNRWLTGEWQEEIIKSKMIVANNFRLKDHIQPLPSLYTTNNQQSPLSSELRSITSHFDSITIRLPNPMNDLSSFRMADVIFNICEATILVSKDLPSSFLAGGISTENPSTEFPHDPTDTTCSTPTVIPVDSTAFRAQVSLTDCSLKVMPVEAYSMLDDERRFTNLLAPTDVTIILSLEHQLQLKPKEGDSCTSTVSSSQRSILSMLLHQVETNVELRGICGALETMNHHAQVIMGQSTRVDKQTSLVNDDIGKGDQVSIICIHVPDIGVNIWGSHNESINTLLCRVHATQFELGIESTNFAEEHQQLESVTKCGITSVAIQILSESKPDHMVKLLSMAENEQSHLIDKAYEFCNATDTGTKRGFLLRSERSSSTAANSVEIDHPLIVNFDMSAIEYFLTMLVGCLLSPNFIESRSEYGQVDKVPTGSVLWTSGKALADLFTASPSTALQTEEVEPSSIASVKLFRLSLEGLLLQIPSKDIARDFAVLLAGIEVAAGNKSNTDSAGSGYQQRPIKKRCGHKCCTWGVTYQLLEDGAPDTFYVVRSKHTLLGVNGSCSQPAQLEVLMPEHSIHWSSPEKLGGSTPPFDVVAMNDLISIFMDAAWPMSSLYFKLFALSPKSESATSEFALASTRLHNSLGTYHHKIHVIMTQLKSDVDKLRMAVFSKERERVGALALASSTAAGFVRVGEELSFSHRIFSTATFHRYWMVLDRSVLLLYNAPGDTMPSYVIPLRSSTELRHISMSSSPNKMATIVEHHVQQKGFAVFTEGATGLFFVTNNDSEFEMWTRAIAKALGKTDAENHPLATDQRVVDDDPIPVPHHEDSPEVFDNAAPASEPPQSPIQEAGPSSAFEVPLDDSKATTAPDNESHELVQAALDDIDFEEISLSDSDKGSNEAPSLAETASTDITSADQSASHNKESLPMRGRLAAAKNKSKMATSRFGSALKTAKGGVLDALATEASPRKEEPKRSLAVGEKMSKLKMNANVKKLAAADVSAMKGKATSKLTSFGSSVRSAVQDQSSKIGKTEDSDKTTTIPTISSSQDEASHSKVSRQEEIRKKLSNLDQSMSNTMKRLKIDEKVTAAAKAAAGGASQLSAAVKNEAMLKQLGNVPRPSNIKPRLGIGEDIKSVKVIKFDARESFSSSSDLPLKVKSISSGDELLIRDKFSEQVASLQTIQGNFAVAVEAIKTPCEVAQANTFAWAYRITTTDVIQKRVIFAQATLPDLMSFHASISEIIARHLPLATQEGLIVGAASDDIFQKLSPIERLRVCGNLLQTLKENPSSSSGASLIKSFLATLLDCPLPEAAVTTTKAFLNIVSLPEDVSSLDNSSPRTNELQSADQAFGALSNTFEKQPLLLQSNTLNTRPQMDQQPLFSVLMDGYTKATKERDEALASLATTSIMNDNRIIKEQRAKGNYSSSNAGGTPTKGSDEADMLNLCKQLGDEITRRTAAESEINRLNERLEFERKIAEAKETELRSLLGNQATVQDQDKAIESIPYSKTL